MSLRPNVCVLCLALVVAAGGSEIVAEQTTERVSVDSAGAPGNHQSIAPAISADGRFVAFASVSSNLVADDTNGFQDIFVRDRRSGTTERVSVSSAGVQADKSSGPGFGTGIAISADGRYVAFASGATNLVAEDTNGLTDVFVHDRATGQTERVSIGSGGQGNERSGITSIALSADGRFVAFDSLTSNLVEGKAHSGVEVFVRDRSTGQTERVSVSGTGALADNESAWPAISADGRFVAFMSFASNLIEGDTNARPDVFVYDRVSRAVERASVASDGTQGNFNSGVGDFNLFTVPLSISGDGRFVAFVSSASNLVDHDTNARPDTFVRDRTGGTTERVSVGSGGEQAFGASAGSAAISADGRFVAFETFGLSAGNGGSDDVFVHDRDTHTTELASVNSFDASSHAPAISADGRFVAFHSLSATQVPGDTNNTWDVFVRDRGAAADTEPPILTVSADITADAASPAGAVVTFAASANDNVDGAVAVTCSPQSGSIFAVGTTTVTCQATDAAANTTSATFDVTVRPFFAPFMALHVEIEADSDEIELKARLQLGAITDGIQPKAEAVTLTVGAFAMTIPAGSFRDDGNGRFRARVNVNGLDLDARIRPMKDGGFEFRANLPLHLAGTLGPSVDVSLTIGNDHGATVARVERD
jgi:Tol biopolymer transport system component